MSQKKGTKTPPDSVQPSRQPTTALYSWPDGRSGLMSSCRGLHMFSSSPVAVDLVVKCWEGSWDYVGRRWERGRRRWKGTALPTGSRRWHTCGCTSLLWGRWRKGSRAERFLGAVGRRVWSFCRRVLPSEHTHAGQSAHNNVCVQTHERLMYDIMWQPASVHTNTQPYVDLYFSDGKSHRCTPLGGCHFLH